MRIQTWTTGMLASLGSEDLVYKQQQQIIMWYCYSKDCTCHYDELIRLHSHIGENM